MLQRSHSRRRCLVSLNIETARSGLINSVHPIFILIGHVDRIVLTAVMGDGILSASRRFDARLVAPKAGVAHLGVELSLSVTCTTVTGHLTIAAFERRLRAA